tara:strand:+ start:633 stop:812 length:180 start_codon:yes stop_codon:yes gene_type:complete
MGILKKHKNVYKKQKIYHRIKMNLECVFVGILIFINRGILYKNLGQPSKALKEFNKAKI